MRTAATHVETEFCNWPGAAMMAPQLTRMTQVVKGMDINMMG
jgi:hypothetical protein